MQRNENYENPDLELRFTFHPASEAQGKLYDEFRAAAKELAYAIELNSPHSREQSLALTHLEETVFWFNAAVARHS
jgi:hypothetical protein